MSRAVVLLGLKVQDDLGIGVIVKAAGRCGRM
jgi:hypothetical protein